MEFRQLKYIYTVYECGSITKAAEKLFISQPSLSSFRRSAPMLLKFNEVLPAREKYGRISGNALR